MFPPGRRVMQLADAPPEEAAAALQRVTFTARVVALRMLDVAAAARVVVAEAFGHKQRRNVLPELHPEVGGAGAS